MSGVMCDEEPQIITFYYNTPCPDFRAPSWFGVKAVGLTMKIAQQDKFNDRFLREFSNLQRLGVTSAVWTWHL